MKMLGLVGGTSWESTIVYYKVLNELARQKAGGLHSCNMLLRSFDFPYVFQHADKGEWDQVVAKLTTAAQTLKEGGAEAIVLCSNTLSQYIAPVSQAVGLPGISLIDALGTRLQERGLRKPLLLGTAYVMRAGSDFQRLLAQGRALDIAVPTEEEKAQVHQIIMDELCMGIVREASRDVFVNIINQHRASGVDSVILGCTEIGLLIQQPHTDLPVFDTTVIHCEAASDFAFSN